LNIPFFARKTKPGNPEFSLLRNGDERVWCARKPSGIAPWDVDEPGVSEFCIIYGAKKGGAFYGYNI
jgi:hypothetical protein